LERLILRSFQVAARVTSFLYGGQLAKSVRRRQMMLSAPTCMRHRHGESASITGRNRCSAEVGSCVPQAAMSKRSKTLFDYLVGASKQQRRHG
jgi:hypothetical protein